MAAVKLPRICYFYSYHVSHFTDSEPYIPNYPKQTLKLFVLQAMADMPPCRSAMSYSTGLGLGPSWLLPAAAAAAAGRCTELMGSSETYLFDYRFGAVGCAVDPWCCEENENACKNRRLHGFHM